MQDKPQNIQEEISRLQWACRRGMLELDVLLGNFLKHSYPDLDKENKARFVALLGCTDPEIFSWLLGHEEPEDNDMKIITEMIKRHGKSGI